MKIFFSLLALLALACDSRAQNLLPIGANLDGFSDYSQTRPFADVFKGSRRFGSAQTPWDGSVIPVDANGWPRGDFGVIVMADVTPDNPALVGTYKLSFRGQATVTGTASNLTVQNYAYNAATNMSTADVVLPVSPQANQMILSFRSVGTGGVQDIKVIMPGYTAADTFTRPFKQHLQRFQAIRFMDWQRTNGNPVRQWSERTTPALPSQCHDDKGVAWEYCIQLCNETQKDLWLNVPVKADDNYIVQLARLVRAQLNPNLKVYLEYSNEVWNFGFSQAQENRDLAIAEVNAGNSDLDDDGGGDYSWAARRVGKRLLQMSNIFRQEFGAAALMTRVRPVLAGQVVNPGAYPGVALEFINKHYGPPKNFFYAVAGAPYFGLETQTATMSKADVLAAFRQSVADIYRPSNTRTSPSDSWMSQATAQATWYGLKHYCYEGGPDTFGPLSIQAKKDASLDTTMRGIVTDYLRGWAGFGGPEGLFMWFQAGATSYDSQYGTWGLGTSMATIETAPKTQGIDRALARIRPAFTAGFSVLDSVDTRQYVGYPATWQSQAYNPYLHPGLHHDYLLNVPTAGAYRLRVRTVALGGGPGTDLRFSVDNAVVDSVAVPRTNPSGNPRFVLTPPVTLQLTAGLHVLRLFYKTENYDNKRLLFERVATPTATAGRTPDETTAALYPNPTAGAVSLSFVSHVAQPVHVAVHDAQGRRVWAKTYAARAGDNALEADLRSLAPALYVVRVRGEQNGQQAALRLVVE